MHSIDFSKIPVLHNRYGDTRVRTPPNERAARYEAELARARERTGDKEAFDRVTKQMKGKGPLVPSSVPFLESDDVLGTRARTGMEDSVNALLGQLDAVDYRGPTPELPDTGGADGDREQVQKMLEAEFHDFDERHGHTLPGSGAKRFISDLGGGSSTARRPTGAIGKRTASQPYVPAPKNATEASTLRVNERLSRGLGRLTGKRMSRKRRRRSG